MATNQENQWTHLGEWSQGATALGQERTALKMLVLQLVRRPDRPPGRTDDRSAARSPGTQPAGINRCAKAPTCSNKTGSSSVSTRSEREAAFATVTSAVTITALPQAGLGGRVLALRCSVRTDKFV